MCEWLALMQTVVQHLTFWVNASHLYVVPNFIYAHKASLIYVPYARKNFAI